MNLKSQANRIGSDLQAGLGFDPATLITILLPMLVSCFKKSTSAQESPREYLADHYDEDSGSFDQHLISRCRRQTRSAARKDGQRRLSPEQLDQITIATLERARTADDDTVSAVMSEV